MQIDLSSMKRWSDGNKLPLNVRKCPYLDFGSKDRTFLFSGRKMKKLIVRKDLGLLICHDLKWTDYIKAACNKTINVPSLLARSSTFLAMPGTSNLFKILNIPVLIYVITCWYAIVDSLKSLESVPRRSLKWVCSDQNRNYKELLSNLETLPLSSYMQIQDLLTLFKCMLGFYNYDFNPYIWSKNCPREIRSSSEVRFDYRKPRKHQPEQKFFCHTGALVKKLPVDY